MNRTSLLATICFSITLMACVKDEPVEPTVPSCTTGTLRCSNTSLHTVQKILLNGTNYGTIDPGEYRDISLAPGNWNLQFVGISGGSGCNATSFNIAACQSMGRACSY
jgi:hypothetical protein